jgi:hypothetical protein
MAEQPAPRYAWSPGANRFRDADSGKFVPKAAVNAALDRVVGDSAANMRALTERLQAGNLTVAQWQAGMTGEIKSSHLAGSALARGGFDHLSPAENGWTGQRIRAQYEYLSKFAEQIASGQQPLDGTALARAEMYGEAGRSTHREMVRRMGRQAGDGWEVNRLGATDSCPGCLGATAAGVVPIGTLVPVGGRDCRTNCHCTIETLTDAEAGRSEAA